MTNLAVSVIVVSRQRPRALQRCLTAISQLDYDNFEVVVVTDPAGLSAIKKLPFAKCLKLEMYDQPNIAKARNIAISLACGEICVFIDDDAVPEPTWLKHLAAVFVNPDVHAACGFVRGRNGISFQSQAGTIDATAREANLPVEGIEPEFLPTKDGKAIKTPGTNCAFRTSTLLNVGGFDSEFSYFLDESELNFRLLKIAGLTAIVPNAQVHHGYFDSDRRLNRMPVSLSDVGSSTAVFLRKHAHLDTHEARLAELRQEQRKILLGRMNSGECEPRDVTRLLKTLEAGILDGLTRDLSQTAPLKSKAMPFRHFFMTPSFSGHKVILGKYRQINELKRQAKKQLESGSRVTLLAFSRSGLFHSVKYEMPGYWVQTGGMYGKSDRSQRAIRWNGIQERANKEIQRFAVVRGLENVRLPSRDER